MKSSFFRLTLICTLLLGAWSAQAKGLVEVSFKQPENFTDLKSTWLTDETLLASLSEHLQTLGQKSLRDGQVLHVEVTDVDLAGSIEPTRHLSQIRVMRDLTSPRINLRYRLEPATDMTAATLRDFSYLTHINHYSSGDPLRYEKQMLDDWFAQTFVKAK